MVFSVGAGLCVRPGDDEHTESGADTQACPFVGVCAKIVRGASAPTFIVRLCVQRRSWPVTRNSSCVCVIVPVKNPARSTSGTKP
jgi:hypothetical protein